MPKLVLPISRQIKVVKNLKCTNAQLRAARGTSLSEQVCGTTCAHTLEKSPLSANTADGALLPKGTKLITRGDISNSGKIIPKNFTYRPY
jgi:hypothetical protein